MGGSLIIFNFGDGQKLFDQHDWQGGDRRDRRLGLCPGRLAIYHPRVEKREMREINCETTTADGLLFENKKGSETSPSYFL
jgi:hypothetical protein